jgi:hypothetical protein
LEGGLDTLGAFMPYNVRLELGTKLEYRRVFDRRGPKRVPDYAYVNVGVEAAMESSLIYGPLRDFGELGRESTTAGAGIRAGIAR